MSAKPIWTENTEYCQTFTKMIELLRAAESWTNELNDLLMDLDRDPVLGEINSLMAQSSESWRASKALNQALSRMRGTMRVARERLERRRAAG